jgi:SAM-dependent methyltransferase
VIGYGTGVTAGELAALELARSVHVAEISQGVIDAAPLFDEGNLNASKNPKVTIRRGDAYRTLLRSEGQYDLILSEPSNPWVTGVEMLYSVEFLEAARKRLAPGGVYAQWFHLYELDVETVQLVLRTYVSVFPHVSVWFTMGPDLLLLGFDRPDRALDVGALEERFRRPDFAAGFERVGIEEFPALLAHELLPLGTLHATVLDGELHTLRRPILSHQAARAFFRGRTATLPRFATLAGARVGWQNSLLRRYSGGSPREPLPEPVLAAATGETCRRTQHAACATLLARGKRDYPESARLGASLERWRSKAPSMLKNESLTEIGVLFGGGRIDDLPGDTPLDRARQSSMLFLQHYHHATPFDRRVLRVLWNRCTAEPCEEARHRVEERLGRFARRAGRTGKGEEGEARERPGQNRREPEAGIDRNRD